MSELKIKVEEARSASRKMSTLTIQAKNRALHAVARGFMENSKRILAANKRDVASAEELLDRGEINEAFLDRLKLDEGKIRSIIDMIRSVAELEDPVSETVYAMELDEGLELYKVTSPIGVIGVVFESRPDALPQIASLCLKSGNTALLKGGVESRKTNSTLYSIIKEATEAEGIPMGWIQLLEEREEVSKLLELDEYVDLIIPRGSNNFVRYIQDNTRIPVLGHAEGVCHIYVDEDAEVNKAVEICIDAKIQYPSVCNAVDTVLVHRKIAKMFLPKLVDKLHNNGVEVRGDHESVKILGRIKRASQDDWGAEYLDYVVALRVVTDLNEAINHVNRYGSHHTDAIITEDKNAALRYLSEVDSASLMWNASTRFSDGYRYGLGAEVGISTSKIHARGPTGLQGLVSYKYYLIGNGHIVDSYVGNQGKPFTHKHLNKKWRETFREKHNPNY
ncbi:MAG: glutamate-5-semialdehyde dehydrogenase [Candidatus Bathyarchaeia archaeon]